MKTEVEVKTIYEKALEKWGAKNQVIVAIEELSELAKALTKILRLMNVNDLEIKDFGVGEYTTVLVYLTEEIADAEIMIEQLKQMFGLEIAVSNEKEAKLERLKERLEKE